MLATGADASLPSAPRSKGCINCVARKTRCGTSTTPPPVILARNYARKSLLCGKLADIVWPLLEMADGRHAEHVKSENRYAEDIEEHSAFS